MSEQIKIALIGIAGYGESYLEALLNDPRGQEVKLVGAVDIAPERSSYLSAIQKRNCTIHRSLESLFKATDVDLTFIATPIHLHARQTCYALEYGSSVLCEKPLAGSLADAALMIQAEDRSGHFVGIGYQWSFSRAIQKLKLDIMNGVFGKPTRFKTIVHYPRGVQYFSRNSWAGRLHTISGDPVLDSPVNNATAHFLHNMFYLLGDSVEASCTPTCVQAELYRANEIENYDTAALRISTDRGTDIMFFTSHSVPHRREPICRFEFENAVVEFDGSKGAEFVAKFRDGRVRSYGHPERDRSEKIWQSIECVRTGTRPVCGIRAAASHTACVIAAQRSSQDITALPAAMCSRVPMGTGEMICADGLEDALMSCFLQNTLPSEQSFTWAKSARPVQISLLQDITRHARSEVA